MPLDPADVAPDEGAIERLEAVCASLSSGGRQSHPGPAGLIPSCYSGQSAVDRWVPDVEGAYVATGHSVWGILNAPATGEALAELILDGRAQTVELAPFEPGRLRPEA